MGGDGRVEGGCLRSLRDVGNDFSDGVGGNASRSATASGPRDGNDAFARRRASCSYDSFTSIAAMILSLLLL